MFERLAGKFLNRLLAKYFEQTQDERKSTQLSVWSGYISFENLQLRPEAVNELLQGKGIPAELVTGSIRSLEITIPWAKLGLTSSTTVSDDSAVAVVVLDGVHVLMRVNYDYNDEALRREAILSRRNALADSDSFGRKETSYAEFLKNRIKEGILKDIMEKIHIHIRDLHFRLEDTTSGPSTAFACGVTLESLHIQAEDEEFVEENDYAAVIRKEGQLNHLAVYWNAIEYDDDLPIELSILSQQNLSELNLAKLLDRGIARRASALASPSRAGSSLELVPNHSYLMSPVDATCHLAFSTDPKNLQQRPSFVASIQVEDLSMHFRDFQCANMNRFKFMLKEYNVAKQYRPYRPQVYVKEDPLAWWHYAVNIILMELRQSRLRWSWGRFHRRFELRRRYCFLYERLCRNPSTQPQVPVSGMVHSPSLQSLSAFETSPSAGSGVDRADINEDNRWAPDAGAGPSPETTMTTNPLNLTARNIQTSTSSQTQEPLSPEEQDELREMEDGVRGDLSVHDIVLYRAIVSARLAVIPKGGTVVRKSRFRKLVSAVTNDDVESKREYERLLAYLENALASGDGPQVDDAKNMVAVSVRFQLSSGCVSLFAPLPSTADQEKQHRRLHQLFMKMTTKTFVTDIDLMGNFESYQLTLSLDTFAATEIRGNYKEYDVLSRWHPEEAGLVEIEEVFDSPLIYVQMTIDPPDHPEYDIGLHANVNAVEIVFAPESEWIRRIGDLIPPKNELSASASLWESFSFNRISAESRWWIASASRALGKHKNFDLDIRIDCPVLSICDTATSYITIDLGKAQILTKSLAGVAIGKLTYASRHSTNAERNDGKSVSLPISGGRSNKVATTDEVSDSSFTDSVSFPIMSTSVNSPLLTLSNSPKRGMDPFFLGSSASSVIGSIAGWGQPYNQSTSSTVDDEPLFRGDDLRSSFYDKFEVRISGTRVWLAAQGASAAELSLLSGLDFVTSVELSVIPSDHYLCRLRTRSLISEVKLSLTEASFVQIGNIIRAWTKQDLSLATSRPTAFTAQDSNASFLLRRQLLADLNDTDSLSDGSSGLDENEFLDVFEGEDEWSEGNWDVDAESVITGGTTPYQNRRKNRKARSISDLSSISDSSQKGRKISSKTAYLNAENLVRLEEGGGNEEDENDDDSDDESFHSAISFGGRLELASCLLEDISKAESEIVVLRAKLSDISFSHISENPAEAGKRRLERQSINLALDRTIAELNAMKASHKDLELSVEIGSADEAHVNSVNMSRLADERGEEDLASSRARSILRYRRRRSSIVEDGVEDVQQRLLKGTNREYFQGAFLIQSLRVAFTGIRGSSDLELEVAKMLFGASNRTCENKVFFSTNFLSLARSVSGNSQDLFRGGGFPISRNVSRVATPHKDVFLRSVFDCGSKGRSYGNGKIIIGLVELNPQASLVSATLPLRKLVKELASNSDGELQGGKGEDPSLLKVCDLFPSLSAHKGQRSIFGHVSVRLASVRVSLLSGQEGTPVGAIVCTDAAVRLSTDLTLDSKRLQCDLLCGNLQLYDYGDESILSPKELAGRRDPYGPLLRARLRLHFSPLSRCDGWVIGHESTSSDGVIDDSFEKVLDIHFGCRVQPFQLVPAKASIMRLLDSATRRISPGVEKRPNTVLSFIIPKSVKVRWRVDLTIQKISLFFAGNRTETGRLADSALQLLVTFYVCAEDRNENCDGIFIRALCHDVSLFRSLDDWPVVERFSIKMVVFSDVLSLSVDRALERHEVPPDSYLCESEAMLGECTFDQGEALDSSRDALRVSLSPIRMKLSAPVTTFLLTIASSYNTVKDDMNVVEATGLTQFPTNIRNFRFVLEAPDIDIKLFQEGGHNSRGGLSRAKSLLSISTTEWQFEVIKKSTSLLAVFGVANFLVNDLSASPGVRAVGPSNKNNSESFLILEVEFRKSVGIPLLRVIVRWGRIQLMVLPSLVSSFLTFLGDIKVPDHKKVVPVPTYEPSIRMLHSSLVSLSFETAGFECVLPTRNIFDHVRGGSNDPVNAVTLRWSSRMNGIFAFVRNQNDSFDDFSSSVDTADMNFEDKMKLLETLYRFSENQLQTLVLLKNKGAGEEAHFGSERGVMAVHLDLQVKDFQAVRTCVNKGEASFAAAGDNGSSPVDFVIVPPEAGEQRITNSIKFLFRYRLFGTSLPSDPDSSFIESTEISQSFELDTDMIDVLVYIRQSVGGMSDAYKVTLKPIFSHFAKDRHRPQRLAGPSKGPISMKIKDLMKRAANVGSARTTGFKITLVPGGATRLTESPIIQFVISDARVGFATIDVPDNFHPTLATKGGTLLGISSALRGDNIIMSDTDRLSQAMFTHATLAGWVNLDVAAHYHNRRLVAWEPLIEKWSVSAQIGIDLVRVLNMTPSVRTDASFVSDEKASVSDDKGGVSKLADSSGPDTGDRFRDIRRLFGSTFNAKQSHRSSESIVRTHSDMPYVLLVSREPDLLSMALYPFHLHSSAMDGGGQSHQKRVMALPGLARIEWLKQFGHPGIVGDRKDGSSGPALSFSLHDMRPLNINLTGALVDIVTTYFCGSSDALIPHWIRNDTGLTIRYIEVLDPERLCRGDAPKPTTLSSGREIPLSLKRAPSQSCDPHRAQITLELGSFEETVGRLDHSKYNVERGSRSTTFFYKAFGRIPVDTVGIHELSFFENTELMPQSAEKRTSPVGKIIVRISLRGGVKLVAVESPMWLCNGIDQELHCEIRDSDGISLLWISKLAKLPEDDDVVGKLRARVPIPADLLQSVDTGLSKLSLFSDATEASFAYSGIISSAASPVGAPRPFSKTSISRGIIHEEEMCIFSHTSGMPLRPIHLSACALRIGSVSVLSNRSKLTRSTDLSIVPEQRMLLLRPPIVIANHLPMLMHVQVRTKKRIVRATSSTIVSQTLLHREKSEHMDNRDAPWTDLGVIDCGRSIRWTGAQKSQEIEIKVRLVDPGDKGWEKFPDWSTVATIRSEPSVTNDREGDGAPTTLTIFDGAGLPLTLSVHLNSGQVIQDYDDSGFDDKMFLGLVDQASRVVEVAVPYWIVDSSGLEIEFLSNKAIAGQFPSWSPPLSSLRRPAPDKHTLLSLGLGELIRDVALEEDPSATKFNIVMMGDDRATRLTMRHHRALMSRESGGQLYLSSWSEPITLHTENSFADIDVTSPSGIAESGHTSLSAASIQDSLALRSSFVRAPLKCGGSRGTKLIHICSRYLVVNELGRDLEVTAGSGQGKSFTVEATRHPVPFHFDDTRPIRFRPKEFGWVWSGRISLGTTNREVTLRLVHRLRGQVIIVNVICSISSRSPSTRIVFRVADPPPFRLENLTMYSFRYGQSSQFVTDEETQHWQRRDLSSDSTLLPYQISDFAWDEPDEGRRSISLELGDFVSQNTAASESRVLGSFALEKITPGSGNLRVASQDVSAQIIADGPTRVLRITDANLPALSGKDDEGELHVNSPERAEGALSIPSHIELKLFHGIGISIVDWSPQELLFVSFDDILLERIVGGTKQERFSLTIGHICADNQTWVTPYPVLLKIGRRRNSGRRRRSSAMELAWTRMLAKQGGLILLSNLEFSIDPVTIRVDGAVANKLLNMILRPVNGAILPSGRQTDQWLESEIRIILGLEDADRLTSKKSGNNLSLSSSLTPATNECLTAALASKIQSRPPLSSLSKSHSSRLIPISDLQRSIQHSSKFYVEKLKISNVKTDLSWSGALPSSFVGLPGILRPALTFESLPVSLRSYTSYHVYGTARDIGEDLKRHYFSVWRVIDILFGLTFRPTFLVRACIFTTREFVASIFDLISQVCSQTEDALLEYVPRDKSSKHWSALRPKGPESASGLYQLLIAKPTLLMASSFRSWSLLTSSLASSLRYSELGGMLAVRSREPRLFANVDGKELLVEYVEGENAGKALLSRVRAGVHLDEGYVFHVENVHIRRKAESSPEASHSPSSIVMVTTERILVLNGDRKTNFCQVLWEASFENVVSLAVDEVEHDFYDLVKIWYLLDTEQSSGNADDSLHRVASAMVGDADLGLDILACKSLFLPQDVASTLLVKVALVHRGVVSIDDDSEKSVCG